MQTNALKDLSWTTVSRNLSKPSNARALYSALIAGALSAAILPSILPSRISFFGIPPLHDIFAHLVGGQEHREKLRKRGLDKWIESEREYAWKRLLKNISPEGTDPGCVVASPSKKDPDYWYQWTRDSAMVFKVVVEYWKRDLNPAGKQATFEYIIDYINESRNMQRMDTPSGGFKSGGLGEVKYNTDGTPYTGSWGRPQNDGPALRASAVMDFCNELLDEDSSKWLDWVKLDIYDSLPYEKTEGLVKADLDYVAKVWHEKCFDLWEEVDAIHHFNMMITLRAMYDGSKFATRLGDTESSKRYLQVAKEIQDYLSKFWDEERGYIQTSLEAGDQKNKSSNLDTATVLGFLHSGDLQACISGLSKQDAGENVEYLGSDKSLVTQMNIAESMRHVFPINERWYPKSKGGKGLGFGIGRYREDVYDGDGKRKNGTGNPWYLCTLAHAEFYYRLIHYFKNKTIVVNTLSAPFFLQIGYFNPNSQTEVELLNAGQKYTVGMKEHEDILNALREKGDAFMRVVRDQAKWNGGLWEQFHRLDGGEMGAPHLTWSYASFLSAEQARNSTPMFQ
ncbi:glycoside hydrolase family 15 protein [Cystobasidium minutum MCA 4210]|uniref:glycoside hydrolase family 15 protein n=1 Tax=Cystobasidium minutum MCA 4210 TaxID=1397322 RepID=UPI0034CFBE74|eukprot:jgi/Rhomi1/165186/fgenesh1_kg.1_\